MDLKRPAVVICQHGRARSNAAAAKLQAACVAEVSILEGGIEAYAAVDSTVAIREPIGVRIRRIRTARPRAIGVRMGTRP